MGQIYPIKVHKHENHLINKGGNIHSADQILPKGRFRKCLSRTRTKKVPHDTDIRGARKLLLHTKILTSSFMEIGSDSSFAVTKNRAKRYACVRFNQATTQVLSFLNNEASSALRQTMGNMDDIQWRFRSTLQEIAQNELTYQNDLRNQPMLCENSEGVTDSANNSEDDGVQQIEEESILPQIITIMHVGEQPSASIQCTNQESSQQTQAALRNLSRSVVKRQLESALRNKAQSLAMALETVAKQDVSSHLRHRIRQMAAQLTGPKNKKASRGSRSGKDSQTSRCAENLKRQTTTEMLVSQVEKRCDTNHVLCRSIKNMNVPPSRLNEQKLYRQAQHDLSRSSLKIKRSVVESVSKRPSQLKLKKKYSNSLFFATAKTSRAKIITAGEACNGSNEINSVQEKIETSVCKVDVPTSTPSMFKTPLKCFDILDEISPFDLKPFQPEYPRKDEIGASASCNRAEDTFLYKLVYNTPEKLFSQLINTSVPEVTCAKHTCRKCNTTKKVQNPVKSKQRRPHLAADVKARNEVADKLRPYLHDPCMQVSPNTITVMPVSVVYDNPDLNRPNNTFGSPKASNNENKRQKSPTRDLLTYLQKTNTGKHENDHVASPIPRHPRMGASGEIARPASPRVHGGARRGRRRHGTTLDAITNCNMSPDMKKTTLENNIQTVIKMIETKIVDTLSNPEKQTSQAFNAIENEIVHILDDMRVKPAQLSSIPEVADKQSLRKEAAPTSPFNKVEHAHDNDEITPTRDAAQKNAAQVFQASDKPEALNVQNTQTPRHISRLVSSNPAEVPHKTCTIVAPKEATKLKKLKKRQSENTPDLQTNEEVPPLDAPSNAISEIKPDSFLTPFMQAVKHHRYDDYNYQSDSARNILEFLDALTTISDDLPSDSHFNGKIVRLHYKRVVHSARVTCMPQIYYPIKVVYPTPSNVWRKTKKIKALTGPNDNNGAGQQRPLMLEGETLLKKTCVEASFETIPIVKKDEHQSFLNSMYSLIFMTMFLGLTFNYSCN